MLPMHARETLSKNIYTTFFTSCERLYRFADNVGGCLKIPKLCGRHIWKRPCADEVGLCARLAVLGDHLELRHLVRVELQHLQKVVQQVPDEQLFVVDDIFVIFLYPHDP